MNHRGQELAPPLLLLGGLLILGLGFITFVLLTPILKTTIDTTKASSSDVTVNFIISLFPIALVIIFLVGGIWLVASRGGGG